ncbi:transglutaminase domain-containing protein [Ruminococcus sp.]|uniref:transglutaminase domain-containing protein n=1 Tax=Ruminococcus sp. TaxID=41978 RepID=UPI0025E8A033|nr:transglutaminase domain-containing protein [Ruminococcus sp.]MBQ8968097.1 transglutaminase [Ruminococcus sp.]
MKKRFLAALLAVSMLAGCSERVVTEESSTEEKTASVTAETEAPAETSAPDESEAEEPEEETEELYDTTPISEAYLSGDTAALDEVQREILDRAGKVIDEVITEDMSDYDKELAIHDYIVRNVTYDKGELSLFGEAGEHAADPLGALRDGECICRGYTTTFRMFMDMLGIPCRSVHASAEGREHAWNIVQLSGHWYYVDVTWDDPVPDAMTYPVKHQYFNTTADVMADRHEWDREGCPEVDSWEDTFIAHNLQTLNTAEEIAAAMDRAYEAGGLNVYFEPEDREGWDLSKEISSEKGYFASDISEECGEAVKMISEKYIKCRMAAYEDRAVVELEMFDSSAESD